MESKWVELPYWKEWGVVTRIHGSAMVAFGESKARHKGENGASVLQCKNGPSDFKTKTSDHLERIEDASDLHKMALINYYAVFEAFCKYISFIIENDAINNILKDLDESKISEIEQRELVGGIEAWTDRIMRSAKQDWSKVYKGKSGIVEVSIIRNAVVHGVTRVGSSLIEGAEKRGAELPFRDGEALVVSFDLMNEYRGRLRSFYRIAADGFVHQARGTHHR